MATIQLPATRTATRIHGRRTEAACPARSDTKTKIPTAIPTATISPEDGLFASSAPLRIPWNKPSRIAKLTIKARGSGRSAIGAIPPLVRRTGTGRYLESRCRRFGRRRNGPPVQCCGGRSEARPIVAPPPRHRCGTTRQTVGDLTRLQRGQ